MRTASEHPRSPHTHTRTRHRGNDSGLVPRELFDVPVGDDRRQPERTLEDAIETLLNRLEAGVAGASCLVCGSEQLDSGGACDACGSQID